MPSSDHIANKLIIGGPKFTITAAVDDKTLKSLPNNLASIIADIPGVTSVFGSASPSNTYTIEVSSRAGLLEEVRYRVCRVLNDLIQARGVDDCRAVLTEDQ